MKEFNIKQENNFFSLSELILEKIFNWDNEKSKEFLKKFELPYNEMEEAFHWIFRKWKNPVPYFDHLKWVTEIVLESLDNPNEEKAIIAILHDYLEDIDNSSYEKIEEKYGKNIALPVLAITKKDKKSYLDKINMSLEDYSNLSKEELIEVNKELKEIRNSNYFSHMKSFNAMKDNISKLGLEKSLNLSDDEIIEITNNVIDVKISDRLHNLEDMLRLLDESDEKSYEKNISFVQRKLDETDKYFKDIVEEKWNKKFQDRFNSIIFNLNKKIIGLKTKSKV